MERDKLGRFIKGHIVTDDIKLKIQIRNKGQIPWNKGKEHSEETKQKIRERLLGKKLSEETEKHLKKLVEDFKKDWKQ